MCCAARRSFALAAAAVAIASLVGCSHFDLRRNIPWGEGTLGELEPPGKIVACWTDTVLHQDGRAVRGFGGRLIFFKRADGDPIKVDGTLVVYAFDETNRDPSNPKPDRKYVFTREQLAEHHSKTKAGHSYSFWIPWEAAGGEQKEISLICRFTPKRGPVIVGEQTRQLLPGTLPLVKADVNKEKRFQLDTSSGIQQVAYAEPATTSRSMTVNTIPLPPQVAQRISQATAPDAAAQQPPQPSGTQQQPAPAQQMPVIQIPPAQQTGSGQQLPVAQQGVVGQQASGVSHAVTLPQIRQHQPAQGVVPQMVQPSATAGGLQPVSSLQQSSQPPVGSPLDSPRALGVPLVPQARDHAQWPQFPARPQFARSFQPTAATATATSMSAPAGVSALR
jgi:hypothetical protein